MSTSPRRLGKYELQEQLGHGGMAEVWKALDTQLQRYVAIKLLHANLKEDPHFIARFEREAQLIASLHHPNIVQIHDFQFVSTEEEGTLVYMVMDYVEGQTLAEYIHSTSGQGKFPSPQEIVHLFTSICLAVDYAHQQGMIHRDLKPANILIDKQNTTRNPVGEAILTDFGLAKLLGVSSSTLTAAQLGTPLYIAPEQVSGYAGNERSDIYSLGIILYEMVAGTPPFLGDSPTVVMSQHLGAAPPPLARFNPNIPPALEMVIMRALAKDPAARFPSASSLAAATAEALNLPIPERLSGPAYPVDDDYLPTFITPSPLSLTPGVPSSTPALMRSTPPPTRSGFSLPSASGGNQSIPPVAVGAGTTPSRSSTKTRLLFGSIAVLIILLGGSLGSYFLFFHSSGVVPPPNPVVGHAFYVSSGQLADGAQGIADQLQVDLQNVPPPPAGKSYYLWLLADKDTTPKPDFLVPPPIHPPILLTNNLPVQSDGVVHYLYPGDAKHDNLLSETSRLLITLDTPGQSPVSPSTDRSTWVYYAELPQELIPHDPTHLRGLDHIRHLYYNEDHLQVYALYGGLDIWVFRNTEKILESATSARDDFNSTTSSYGAMHVLFIRILDYLDGTKNVHLDVPPGTVVAADPLFASVSLLTVDPNHVTGQNPPGDFDHMMLHVGELNSAPDATPQMHTLSQEIIVALQNAKGWLQQARVYAKQLFDMSPAQLAQPATRILLDNLVTLATYAYIGQLNPTTNTTTPGVLQAHYDVSKLATFDVSKNVPATL